MKPELVVFGTSPLVSAELHTAIRRLFGDTYPVREALTEDAAREDPEKDACWIAAPIQYPHVSRFLPKEKTFLLDMQPAAEFFLAMTARVPEGAPISVFNNRKAYAERFIGQMKDRIRGITRTPRFPMKTCLKKQSFPSLERPGISPAPAALPEKVQFSARAPTKNPSQKM